VLSPTTRGVFFAAVSLVIAALPFGPGAAQASGGGGQATSSPVLSAPAHGQQAILRLGDRLGAVAARSGWSSAQLRRVLLTDPSAWVATDGQVFYKEPPATAGADADVPPAVPPFPLADTFALHSKPGSDRVLFIDTDGNHGAGSAWGLPDIDYPAYDPAGDGAAFNDQEKAYVQTIWQRVAEDYAAFDVDVTTEDPGADAILRADSADQKYGTRAVVSPSLDAESGACGPPPACGGVAYVGIFDQTGSAYASHQPAWVFPHELGGSGLGGMGNPKSVAEAIAHEVGHNFGLSHDGLTGGATNQDGACAPTQLAYFCGQAMWAPIMGAGYYKPVTQWSRGEYTNANQSQNDVTIISQHAAYRADEAGDTLQGASSTTAGTKYITTRTDQDVYQLGTCTGPVSVNVETASPGNPSPDLDLQLDLLDSGGAVVDTDDPPSALVGPGVREPAVGLDATVGTAATGGSYYVRVDGVGHGDGTTAYSDYASIGAYVLTITGTCTTGTGAPGAPRSVSATGDGATRSARVTWAAPADIGGGAVTGYSVSVNGAPAATTDAPGATLTGLPLATPLTISVAATNASGTGPAAQAAPITLLARPGAPSIGRVRSGKRGGRLTVSVSWAAPTDNGGAAVTAYQVEILNRSGHVVRTASVGAGRTSLEARLKHGGKYAFVVTAVNSVGAGAPSAASKAVKAR